MRITVFGAGAVGGMIAARLAASGADPAIVARGATARALARDGLILVDKDERFETRPRVTEDPASLGPQDVVILTLKAHQIADALPSIRPLIGPDTLIVPAINGVPWWYFQGQNGPLAGARLDSLDPDGRLAEAFPAERIAGCVVYVAAETPKPGQVHSVGIRRLILGPVVGAPGPMLETLATMLSEAGFKAPVEPDIRTAVWVKLWGNLWANPLSVATGATMGALGDDPAIRETAKRMMTESRDVAHALGIDLSMDIDKRLEQGFQLKDFKTSMLQDFERGRPIELDAILGAVREIGARLDLETPTLDIVYGIVRLRAAHAGAR